MVPNDSTVLHNRFFFFFLIQILLPLVDNSTLLVLVAIDGNRLNGIVINDSTKENVGINIKVVMKSDVVEIKII